jgi:hypothetical protein
MRIDLLTSGGNEHSWFKSYAEQAIELLLSKKVEISKTGSEGGYLSIFQPKPDYPPRMEYLISCGSFPKEKREPYLYYSMEKAFRLNSNIKRGHKASRESADEMFNEFPGAVYFEEEKRIFSFSGLNAEIDEFISILVSCFNYYLHNQRNYPDYSVLEDVPGFFRVRSGLICVTDKVMNKMIVVVDEIVTSEIKLRDSKR